MSVSVANINAMRALPTSGFNLSLANTVYVATQDDFYRFIPGGTLTPTTGLVYASSDGLGQWSRMLIPSVKWRTQTTWSIDESNYSGRADDENTGIDDAHPLLNVDEFLRRMSRIDGGSCTVRWMSDTTHAHVNLAPISPGSTPSSTPNGFPLITFVGVPIVLRTGTLTGAADAPWTVSDSTLSTSWAASGLISTSAGTRLIRKTDLTKHAFIAYENSAKTAQTSPTNGYSEAYSITGFGTQAASFANGDAYEVLSLPSFPEVTPPHYTAGWGATIFLLLDMNGVTGGYAHMRHCGFRAAGSSLNTALESGVHQLYGGIFTGGAFLAGSYASNVVSRTLFMGGLSTMVSYNGDMNGKTNAIAKTGTFSIAHGSFPRLGTMYAFDCTATPVIQITNNSSVTIDALHGASNTGVLVDVRDPGCSVNSQSTSALFDATTSAAHPITIAAVTKDYADLPFWNTNKNCGFSTN
jgi:hypothetical protein